MVWEDVITDHWCLIMLPYSFLSTLRLWDTQSVQEDAVDCTCNVIIAIFIALDIAASLRLSGLISIQDTQTVRRAAISSTAGDSALHIACLAGNFYIGIRTRVLNQNGLCPLHISAATGNIETLQELLKVDIGLCFINGRERRTPLHCASMKGHVDVVKELVLAGVGSIEMVTSRGETALHLAVKSI
ncbi:hypothetical protein Salat_2844500 [Sesamum alatum]|uniref:Uncharacterized protein n=1 Tax=Sesamum alatum TaxID=300844 RepID=A0AAE1XLY9_9LAMI|nr:hypothetical protein Salat_2844500 [Sesamum alatum]